MKRVVIAGVSGAIGGALATRLIERDPEVRVIGLCRNPERAPEALHAHGRSAVLAWDAEGENAATAAAAALESILSREEGIDTFIYAAGLLHGTDIFPEKRLEDLSAASLARSFAVNATGFSMLAQALLPWLRHREFKRVAAISAKVGSITDNGFGGWYAYRSSKAALNMLVRNLSIELPRRCKPVACVSLHPGTTESALSEPFSQSLAKLKVHSARATACNLLDVLDAVVDEDNGRFLSWDGSELPW
ncbi:SDR family NAD(P)-dependent oxidoreductase [Marinobacter sp. F3R08]|uniref:SDR family NAD(P)-dependent oxidoreductase n=1 Tax=Marinobacter sp. F3R08 TaxID=2841559 RepID=UPI001C095159|nr:SDR family NAD(P)-dependent oxidoreductase [Marinobacter sp. F3R08]MBU2954677.1 SDR family NAD(P)-dependent oxidoreductase [Marinobacter sp. F3R08]